VALALTRRAERWRDVAAETDGPRRTLITRNRSSPTHTRGDSRQQSGVQPEGQDLRAWLCYWPCARSRVDESRPESSSRLLSPSPKPSAGLVGKPLGQYSGAQGTPRPPARAPRKGEGRGEARALCNLLHTRHPHFFDQTGLVLSVRFCQYAVSVRSRAFADSTIGAVSARARTFQLRVSDREHEAIRRRAGELGMSKFARLMLLEGSLPRHAQNGQQRNGEGAQEAPEEKSILEPVSSPQRHQEAQEGPSPPPPTPPFRCPDGRCNYTAKSPAARCRIHGRQVVRIEERIGS
jgi:hypothetical protein